MQDDDESLFFQVPTVDFIAPCNSGAFLDGTTFQFSELKFHLPPEDTYAFDGTTDYCVLMNQMGKIFAVVVFLDDDTMKLRVPADLPYTVDQQLNLDRLYNNVVNDPNRNCNENTTFVNEPAEAVGNTESNPSQFACVVNNSAEVFDSQLKNHELTAEEQIELQILDYLEKCEVNNVTTNNNVNDEEPNLHAETVEILENIPSSSKFGNENILSKCKNCQKLFNTTQFATHICDYDKNHEHIPELQIFFDEEFKEIEEKSTKIENDIQHVEYTAAEMALIERNRAELIPSTDHPCHRSLRENILRCQSVLRRLRTPLPLVQMNVHEPVQNEKRQLKKEENDVKASSSTKRSYQCMQCERQFVNYAALQRHIEKHTLDLLPVIKFNAAQNQKKGLNKVQAMLLCKECGLTFFKTKDAIAHFTNHFAVDTGEFLENDNTAQQSVSFDKGFEVLKIQAAEILQLEGEALPPFKYLEVYAAENYLQCEFCDFIFARPNDLLAHSASHSPMRPFECNTCQVSFKTVKALTQHFLIDCACKRELVRENKIRIPAIYICNICLEQFRSLDLLHDHRYGNKHYFPRINTVTQELELPCEFCPEVFNNSTDIFDHFTNKHDMKISQKRIGITGKQRTHLCQICGKTYTQSSHLGQHLRFHEGKKPFECKVEGCDRRFTIRPDLNDHMRKCHTGERPYHCTICGKRFLTGSVFYQHRLIHRGERRYECEQCNKRFYRADALKNHQRIHTGEKPFGCIYCSKSFRQCGDRDKHMRSRHGNLNKNARLMMQMQKHGSLQEVADMEEVPHNEENVNIVD